MRISRDRGRNYPQRYEQDLSSDLPSRPAAVLIHSGDGTCRTLCLDFDAKGPTGDSQVLSDVHLISGLLHSTGAAWIRDRSPSGGRHLYVPLADPLPFHRARELVEALAVIATTLDPSPHRGLRHGCIRPPGSVHRTGGHQQLEMELDEAIAVATNPNGPDAIERLWAELADQREIVHAQRTPEAQQEDWPLAAETASVGHLGGTESTRGMSSAMLAIARHGAWDNTQYPSASEARQAVLVNAAGAGLRLTDVQRRMHTGTWPGLAQFYARYSPAHRHASLGRDWREAQRFVNQGRSPVRRTNTSQPYTQRGATDFQFVRTWLNALAASESRHGNDRRGLLKRMLLRSIAEACMKTGARSISFGVRALAVACGTDAGTISRHLKELIRESTPLLRLSSRGRGIEADTYELVIPDHLSEGARSRSWRPGKIHALRPAFRELGVPEALVFEQLENSANPLPVRSLVTNTGLSRTAVNDALTVLASWKLAAGAGGLWTLVPGADGGYLEALAERLGATEQVLAQISRYRTERAEWHAWLRARAEVRAAGYVDDLEYRNLLWELTEPPPEDGEPPPLA
ncbi:MarR family transcriptional regulator (plasmid) [Citricoccus nitrophenolicus]